MPRRLSSASGPCLRIGSATLSGSTRMTSAPSSASWYVQNGPAMTWVASSTRMPASGERRAAAAPAASPRGASPSATDDAAEKDPTLAVEPLQLHLPDGSEIRRTGVDVDARQHHRQLHVPEIGGLAHDIFARQLIATLSQNDFHGLRSAVAIDVEAVGDVGVGIVFLHPGKPILVA